MESIKGPLSGYSDPNSANFKSTISDGKGDIYAFCIIPFRLLENGRFPFNRIKPVDLSILHWIGNNKMGLNASVDLMSVVSGALMFNRVDRAAIGEMHKILNCFLG